MFPFRPRCPVDPTTRGWINRRWKWLMDEFGSDFMIDAPTVLPASQFFPDRYDAPKWKKHLSFAVRSESKSALKFLQSQRNEKHT